MSLPVVLVDAFTERPFGGNPAAVCVLDEPLAEEWMQAIAAELNQTETAFLHRITDGDDDPTWAMRWFTPTTEVELGGHASLAAAHHLVTDLGVDAPRLRFVTLSGVLVAQVGHDGWIEIGFPADPPVETEPPPGLLAALGHPEVVTVARGREDWLVETDSADTVRALRPDHRALAALKDDDVPHGVIVTAVGEGLYDMVSRYFAPAIGVDEGAVTGSSHTTLGPFWAERFAKSDLLARQLSTRGGAVRVTVVEDRVLLAGQAVTVVRGEVGGDVLAERIAVRLVTDAAAR
ncbi:MAG: PhzF family phenazine biosynthesis protein [Acidimicrobiales bacterium]|jgi:PhzF family phenazine biosynthesis protein|nr:PhzF family phenazine biosynthesis protein [Acidimicrobiales bacterium]